VFIFLYGADSYRSRQKLKEIVEHYKKIRKKGLLSLEYLDGQNIKIQDLKNKIQQISIFKEKKLIILFDFFLNIDIKKKFLEEEKKNNFLTKIVNLDDIVLFFEEKEVSKKDPFFIYVKKHSKSQEFKLLDRQKLKNWVKKEFTNYQKEINLDALEQLINFVGNDLWQLSNEIKKLINYKKDKKIEIEDVNLLVNSKVEVDIFKTIEAIATKNKKDALNLLYKHIEKGDNPLYLFSMITFQFRNLLIIRELIDKGGSFSYLLKESKLHPFVVKKTYYQAQKFTFQELKKIFQKIFELDLKIKTGQIDAKLALDLFILEI